MQILDKVREILSKPLVVAVLGFIIGLIIGLPILGWGLLPVQWTDADPSFLRDDLKKDYLRMTIDSYTLNRDKELAKQRWDSLGKEAQEVFKSLQGDPKIMPESLALFNEVLKGSNVAVAETSQPGAASPTPGLSSTPGMSTTEEKSEEGGIAGISPLVIAGVAFLCLMIFIIIGAMAYILLVRNKKGTPRTPARATQTYSQPEAHKPEVTPVTPPSIDTNAPVSQFMTTYTIGDDLYDDSFSIDAPSGEFLGECGVGISDTIGSGDPKKVSAFEVWLFDKNDVQTVTKVLLSENGYNDPAERQKLEAKGEPLLIEAGQEIILETATLRLDARVVDMNYGQGALPPNSFIDRLTLELTVWSKTGGGESLL